MYGSFCACYITSDLGIKNKRPKGLDGLLDHLSDAISIDYTGNVAEVTYLQSTIKFLIFGRTPNQVITCIPPITMLSIKFG